jgi:peptidyl-prolyl cis-trans isomerase B (cyclophilin B)
MPVARCAGALAALTLVFLVAGCGGDDGEEDAATTPTQAAAPATPGCRDVAQPEAKPVAPGKAPTTILSVTKTYRVIVKTSCGSFTITLDPEASPKTTASFVALAENDFYDGTFFHRIVPNFVIQGGDPTGTGTGGPGYTTVDTPAAGTRYTSGVVAMAKTATEPRGTAGSQFFIVTGDDAGLPPDYAVIGRITGGKDVVARIAVLGDPNTELPTQPVVVDDMVARIQ